MPTFVVLFIMRQAKNKINCTECQFKATSAFCTLKPTELESLNDYKQTFELKKKQVLFYEDDLVKGLYCVHQGKVKIYKTLNDGNIQILRLSKNSDLIGYRGLLGNERYIATAETLEDSIICFIPKERIFQLISTNLNFTLGLMSKIASDISEAENKAVNFLQKSSKERLAEALLVLEQSFGNTNDGYINISLTRIDLAGITGLAIETIVRLLHKWENENLVQLNKKLIKILKPKEILDLSGIED